MVRLFMMIGVVVAAITSWQCYHSWGWAILHGLFSWFYIVYYLLAY